MQHSIFEPLYCLPTMEAPKLSLTPPSPSLFTISPPSPSSSFLNTINRDHPPFSLDQDISCGLHAHIITPSSSSTYKKARSAQHLTSDLTHVHLPLSHSTLSATTSSPSSRSDADHDRKCDDGSVASKLLSSITKSISSPSLQLKTSKEAARETPYQKTLKLKHMKLQHCAEALGMESSDNSSFLNHDSQCIHQEKIGMIGSPSNYPPSFTLPNSHHESPLKSVKSSPNLSCAPPLMTNQSRYTRSTSFPPPLSHTLPTSSSYDSLSISLRAYREDGRFILKEVMVPSKHYFQANRRNGRLTLHVVTREAEEEEEHFAGQAGDHEEFSYRESQREKLSEVEEEGIPMCMVSLQYEGKSFDNKLVEDSNNTNQSLKEEVCVKKSLGMHNSKVIHVAASHLDMSLNCIANHMNNNKDSEDDNVISNLITLSLETSKVTLHKAQVLSFPHLSSYPKISSSLKQSAFIHSTGRNHGFLSSNHDISTFPQSKENFIWESNLMPCAVATSGSWRIQRKSCGGSGGGGAVPPAFVMEEISAKSLLMKAVSELATSLIVEASYASGGKKKLPSLSEVENGESGTIIGGYASDKYSDIMEGKIIGNDNGLISHGANFANFGYKISSEEEKASEGGNKELNITLASPLNHELQFSSSNASEEWLHTLYCKELFDRHQLGQGLIKLHCIPARS